MVQLLQHPVHEIKGRKSLTATEDGGWSYTANHTNAPHNSSSIDHLSLLITSLKTYVTQEPQSNSLMDNRLQDQVNIWLSGCN